MTGQRINLNELSFRILRFDALPGLRRERLDDSILHYPVRHRTLFMFNHFESCTSLRIMTVKTTANPIWIGAYSGQRRLGVDVAKPHASFSRRDPLEYTNMKRGFLKNRSLGPSSSSHPPSVATPKPPPPREAETPPKLTAYLSAVSSDTTSVYSANPRIVCADTRIAKSPYFLYLPAAAGQASLVYIDYLENVVQVSRWSIWRQPAPKPSQPSFRIATAAGKGAGMFATKEIRAGELVWAERPVYATRKGLEWAHDQTRANGIFQHNSLRGLSDSARASVLALKNSYPDEENIDVVLGTLLTNYLGIDMTEKPLKENEFSGCFPTLSRANHSCRPSVNYFWSFPTFCGQFWATRDIAEGEEITISYASLTDTSSERQSFLKSGFFFTCTCETCSLPPALLRKSDARREGLGKLISRIAGSYPRIPIEELEEGLQWAEQEGLTIHRAGLMLHGSGVVLMHHGSNLGAQWAERARDVFRVVEGPGSYNVKDLDRLSKMYRMMATRGIDPMQTLRLAQQLA
ncbi:hypothetical protein B0H21DRAFT_729758 [Amylocystis lapponica]|nr:hypothetical protein B0H21DRAFT_729758 [Amylocystis lapponica]